MDIQQVLAFANALRTSTPAPKTILTGTVVSNSTGGYQVRGSYSTDGDNHVNVPAALASAPINAGVLMISPGGDGQDMSILGVSGYYYAR